MRKKRVYSAEFKRKAIALSYARGNVSDACRELDIPKSVLSRWRGEAKTVFQVMVKQNRLMIKKR